MTGAAGCGLVRGAGGGAVCWAHSAGTDVTVINASQDNTLRMETLPGRITRSAGRPHRLQGSWCKAWSKHILAKEKPAVEESLDEYRRIVDPGRRGATRAPGLPVRGAGPDLCRTRPADGPVRRSPR